MYRDLQEETSAVLKDGYEDNIDSIFIKCVLAMEKNCNV